MKTLAFFLLFFIGLINVAIGQQLNEYKYVQVPETFAFMSEENEYQLNALTAFLLEKNGFEVFYEESIPANVAVCDVLKANVEKGKGFLTTRVKLILEDCKGREVFVSEEGESREKNYKKAYQAALRNAFVSLEAMDYSFTGGNVEEEFPEPGEALEATEEAVSDKMEAEKAIPEVVPGKGAGPFSLRNGTMEYTLKRTPAGYSLFKGKDEEFAVLLRSAGGNNYIFSSQNLQGSAFFDADGNLIAEYYDRNSGQLVSVTYRLQDQ